VDILPTWTMNSGFESQTEKAFRNWSAARWYNLDLLSGLPITGKRSFGSGPGRDLLAGIAPGD
jgi:hypothetical protein